MPSPASLEASARQGVRSSGPRIFGRRIFGRRIFGRRIFRGGAFRGQVTGPRRSLRRHQDRCLGPDRQRDGPENPTRTIPIENADRDLTAADRVGGQRKTRPQLESRLATLQIAARAVGSAGDPRRPDRRAKTNGLARRSKPPPGLPPSRHRLSNRNHPSRVRRAVGPGKRRRGRPTDPKRSPPQYHPHRPAPRLAERHKTVSDTFFSHTRRRLAGPGRTASG